MLNVMSYLTFALHKHLEDHEQGCAGLPSHVHAMHYDPGFKLWVDEADMVGDTSARQIRLWDMTTQTITILADVTATLSQTEFSWGDQIGMDRSYVGWMLTGGLGLVTHHNVPWAIHLRDQLGLKVITELLVEPGLWSLESWQVRDLWHEILQDKYADWRPTE